jgi:hypothetical protein
MRNDDREEQDGFEDRSSATTWVTRQLVEYLAARDSSKARKKQNRSARREQEAWLDDQTLQILADLSRKDGFAAPLLKYRADLLWQEVAFRALKRSETEPAAN